MEIRKIVEKLLVMNKTRAETEYLVGFLIRNGTDENDERIVELKHHIDALNKEIGKLNDELSKFGIQYFVPNETKITQFTEKIKGYSEEDIDKAMRIKNGEVWDVLKARGELIKKNIEMKKEIGILIELIAALPKDKREPLIEIIKNGDWGEHMPIDIGDKTLAKNIAKAMNRIGIYTEAEEGRIKRDGEIAEEVRFTIDDKPIWVPKEKAEEIREFIKQLNNTSIQVQVKNAEKQVKKFSKEEEEAFDQLQLKYLNLIKRKKEIISMYGI